MDPWPVKERPGRARRARIAAELRRLVEELDSIGLPIAANHASLAADLVELD